MARIPKLTQAVFRAQKASARQQQQSIASERKTAEICKRVAKECGILKPVVVWKNQNTGTTFKNLDFICGDFEWAPWSFVRRMWRQRW